MSNFDALELTKTVHGVLRVSATMSHGSMVFPYGAGAVWPERRAARAAPLKQWLLERDTFETEVVKQYGELNTSEVRELVAGTGVGKSTRMPYLIAKHHNVNGLVLLPNHYLPLHISLYLVAQFARMGGEVSVAQLRTSHQDIPNQTPCVYLSSAATFLGRLAAKPTLLRDLGIDFIYLDESHEKVPDYTFFKYLVSSRVIEGCKVFYGTATASTDVSMESGGVGRSVQAVPVDVMSVASPSGATSKSPLHFSRITGRTLVVLANDHEINSWFSYYNNHDVPVYKCTMAGGTKPMNDIDQFLEQNVLCVVLVYHLHRTGITVDITTVVCGGYYSKVVTDFSNATVKVVRTPVTQSLRVQTMGRVGRMQFGTGYYADVDVSPEATGMELDAAFYVYLWAQVFNLRINDPAISGFVEVTGDMTSLASAILLHSRLPPVLLLPYVGNNGFRSGWAKVAPYVLYSKQSDNLVDQADVDTSAWVSFTTGPVTYAKTPVEYKSMITFPREWSVIPAYAWSLYQGIDVIPRGMRAFSVISATPTEVVRSTPRQSVMSMNTVSSHALIPPKHAEIRRPVTPFQRDSVVSGLVGQENTLGVPRYADVRDAMSMRDSMPRVNTPPPMNHSRSGSRNDATVRDLVQRPHVVTQGFVESWRASLPTSPKPIQRVDSVSSDDRDVMQLRLVDPVKYKYHKLYPMDTAMFDALIADESMTRSDRSRLNSLLTGSRNVVSLGGDATTRKDKQGRYFLAVLRVHNHAVSQRAQLGSNVRMTLMEKAVMNLNGNVKRADEDITESAKMLQAFQLESWFVGIDRRAPRASDSSEDMVSPDYDYDEVRAKVMLAMGPDAVVGIVEALSSRSVPYEQNGKVVCNAWVFNDNVISVGHAYDENKVSHQLSDTLIHESNTDDFVVFHSTKGYPGTVGCRDPNGVESVYVLTYDKYQNKMIVVGDYTLVAAGDIAYLHTLLEKGNSGALVLSTDDGAVLGMYVAYFGDSDGVPLSLVVPVSKFYRFVN